MVEVSPEFFELLELWLSADGTDEHVSLADFVADRDPVLLDEVERVLGPKRSLGFRSHQCSCRLVSTIDAIVTPYGGEWLDAEKGNAYWGTVANGAAHQGDFDRECGHCLSEYDRSNTIGHETKIRTQMVCTDEDALPCAGFCNAQMYVHAEYGSRLYGAATTGGIWSRSAHASAADAVKLTYKPPFQSTQVLFQKAGSVSHYARQIAYDPLATLTVVVNLALITAEITISESSPDDDLVSETVTALAKMISGSGGDGSTQQDMYVEYDPFSTGFFDISYSSDANYVHTVALTSYGATQNRGWGGKNWDHATYASGYLLNIAVNHLECDTDVTTPLDGCVSRHATTPGAPYSDADLQAKKAAFYGVLATPCGDADGDGVSDQDDLCEHTLDGTDVGADGCSLSGSLTCNDGTYSSSCTCNESWQGCCSYHGGVAGCG